MKIWKDKYKMYVINQHNITSGGVPTNGLIVQWLFDNNTLDSVGTNNATATGTSYVTDHKGSPNSAIRMEGNFTSSLNAMSQIIGTGSDGSVSLWLKNDENVPALRDYAGGIGIGFSAGDSTYPYTNGLGYFWTLRSTARVNNVNVSAVDKSTWHLVTVTSTPGVNGYKIYQNTTLIYTGTGDAIIYPPPGDNTEIMTTRYTGELSRVRVYERVLDLTDIQNIFNE